MNLLVILTVWAGLLASDPTFEETLTGTLQVSSTAKAVVIDNINGRVTVKKGSDQEVKYTIRRYLSGESQRYLDQAREEVKLSIIERNDSVIFFIKAPFLCSQWDGCYKKGRWFHRGDDQHYDFGFDFEIEMPEQMALNVQTVQQGDLSIDGIRGSVSASHVNGDVMLTDVKSVSRAATVNGDVTVNFDGRPDLDGDYRTINGTITLKCSEPLQANVTAKTMNGSLYSAFDYTAEGPQLVKTEEKDGTTTTYKLEETFNIAIGKAGGPKLHFETLNGNIYLKKL